MRRTPARGHIRRVWLERISIRDFRNLQRVDLYLPANGVAILGENGHGKTNLLESIFYLQTLRAERAARDQDVTRFGAAGFHLSAKYRTSGPHEISVGFEKSTKRKKVTLDGASPRKLSEAFGALPAVMFSPRDLELVTGAPSERRRFLDLVLALTSRKYLNSLQNYRANLIRRNAALRDATRRGANDSRVSVWEPALAEHGTVLIEERCAWVAELAEEFTRLCTTIGERGAAKMKYASPFAEMGAGARYDAMLAALEEKRPHDMKRGLTQVGPHRDELELTLDGHELRFFGSAGQQRTAAIALRMLEAATLRKHAGMEPLLLLDDPFAELDLRRASKILTLLKRGGLGQTVLAVPRESDIPPGLMNLDRMTIKDGVLKKAEE
ncbi:MAG: DNA replication and repair protein RecF [Gemmatimonadaceae bacterium]